MICFYWILKTSIFLLLLLFFLSDSLYFPGLYFICRRSSFCHFFRSCCGFWLLRKNCFQQSMPQNGWIAWSGWAMSCTIADVSKFCLIYQRYPMGHLTWNSWLWLVYFILKLLYLKKYENSVLEKNMIMHTLLNKLFFIWHISGIWNAPKKTTFTLSLLFIYFKLYIKLLQTNVVWQNLKVISNKLLL